VVVAGATICSPVDLIGSGGAGERFLEAAADLARSGLAVCAGVPRRCGLVAFGFRVFAAMNG